MSTVENDIRHVASFMTIAWVYTERCMLCILFGSRDLDHTTVVSKRFFAVNEVFMKQKAKIYDAINIVVATVYYI